MKLKKATISNLDELFDLICQFYKHFNYPFEPIEHKKMVYAFLKNKHLGSIWLVMYEKKAVGYIALTYGFTFEFGGRDAFIDEFFITETHRNLGLGHFMVKEIQNKTKDLGLVGLHLQTEKYNERAKVLYQSLDFKDFDRSTLTWISDTPSVFQDFLM